MNTSHRDNEPNPNSLARAAQEAARQVKDQLNKAAQQTKAAAAVCQDKAKAAATVCQDKVKAAAAVVYNEETRALAARCRDKAKAVLALCQAKAQAAFALVYNDKTRAMLARCWEKAKAVAALCGAKAKVVFARVYNEKTQAVLARCGDKAKAVAQLCSAKAQAVFARVYNEKAQAVVARCRNKVQAVTQLCQTKAESAAMVCHDLALVAWTKGLRGAAAQWEQTRYYAAQLWEESGILARKFRVRLDRHPISPLLYITLLSVGIGAVAFNDTYTKAYVAYVDGQEVGLVSSEEELNSIVGNVETRVASVLGQEFDYNAEITLAPTYLDSTTHTDARAVEDALFADTGAMIQAYALSVDGQELGYAQTQQELEQLLQQIVQPYLTEQTLSYQFLQNVEIFPVELPANTQFSLETLLATLTANKEEAQYTYVEPNDTFNKISQRVGITSEQLQALNPTVDSSKLYVGDELMIKQAVPTLTVQTVVTQTYQETIPSPVEYVETDSLYKGTTKVKSQGQDGVVQVEAQVTLTNGVETARTEVSRTTVQEATTTYMYQGTKEKPATASKGYFKWPLYGNITSRYGYRYIFGSTSFHSGLDIAAPYGTTISAADGGTVTYAGWKGSYGNVVIITHDNGMQTYYAHCSSLLVSAGTKVYQGQAIARVGMTGTATGYHCHFEVRVGGKSVNPENYL